MGQPQLSPGQSEAPPWVNVRLRVVALKGQNSPALRVGWTVLFGPFRATDIEEGGVPRAALRSALG